MFTWHRYVQDREYGRLPRIAWRDAMYSSLYKSFQTSTTTEQSLIADGDWGSVFGFGFATDGSILVAACEKRCIMLYDPHNAKLIARRYKTHKNCVNCVRFLDNRTFVTCSDDKTVRIWDARNLRKEVQQLKGHKNWVKNIEYCPNAGKLVTSGFDGNILSWDINNYSEDIRPEKLLFINGVMRTKISEDETKLVLTTSGGFIMVVHNLDLAHLKGDLQGFTPRSMANSDSASSSSRYGNMFSRNRNRVEFISDFPQGNEAESIASVEIHPKSWCVLSRNTSCDELSEWTCVHDIQTDSRFICKQFASRRISNNFTGINLERRMLERIPSVYNYLFPNVNVGSLDIDLAGILTSIVDHPQRPVSGPFLSALERIGVVPPTELENEATSSGSAGSIEHESSGSRHQNSSEEETQQSQGSMEVESGEKDTNTESASKPHGRLLFHSEEPNMGHGYIKEPCFSPDGRIIASPFANSVRLLAFNSSCSELCDVSQSKPKPLHQVGLTVGNKSIVLCTAFSPVHFRYAAGCEGGSISFCSPRL